MEKLEKEFIKSGGTWKEYRIGCLFDIRPTKNYGYTNQKLFESKGNIPVVVNSSLSNGIGGYIDLEPTELGNIITFSDTTTSDSIFYQPSPFIGYSHVQGMYPYHPEDWNQKRLLYFCSVFRHKTTGLFDYGNKFNRKKVREIYVPLPTLNNEIAFSFMERYIEELEAERIEELEAERIEELEAYLKATGLKNYELSQNDVKSLDEFNEIAYTTPRKIIIREAA